MNTKHYNLDKKIRCETIEKYIGYGNDIFSVKIDKGHKNGAEIHTVTDSGIIKIYNAQTKRHITDLIARPNQIKRVYNSVGKFAPQWLLDVAYDNQKRGYNIV